ncbi:uncharacterized protein LOC116115224 [Pistacia vera]|uniref:uncharacterized protein LOC116115224 n=1 Tax=Pistacia vera TaxID=55513 RepID=UPI001263983B|nr:uncharacterized protein LOC116115224 [Pistacia vera]
MQKTTQAWFIRGPSTANSNDHQQKPLSLLADWNTYAFSQESDSSTFDLEATVRTTTDKVSGTFSVCDEFERLSGFSSLVALLVLTSMAVGLMKSLRTLGKPLLRCMMRLSRNPDLR